MDISILLFLQNLRSSLGGVFDEIFSFITMIAVDYYIIIIPLVIYWVFDKKKGLLVYLSLGLSCLLNAFLKATFCIYRPWIRCSDIKPLESALPGATGYSFPSGHSTCVSSTYSALANGYKKHKGIVVFSIVMIALTMFSRLFAGVHTPQDVLVGCLLGLFSTSVVFAISRYLDSHPDKDWVILLVASIITIAVLIYVTFKSYPQTYVDGMLLVDPATMRINSYKDPGTFFGIVLAWFIERRYIKFNNDGTTYQKVMRSIIGILLMIAYHCIVVNAIGKLINSNIIHFLLRASLPLIFICLYPLTWKRNIAND